MAVPRPELQGHCASDYVDKDEVLTRMCKRVSLSNVFGLSILLLRVHCQIVNDEPFENSRDSAANVEKSRGAE